MNTLILGTTNETPNLEDHRTLSAARWCDLGAGHSPYALKCRPTQRAF